MILVGKEATANGDVLVAHNLELSGRESALIEKYPAEKHKPGETVSFSTGLKIPEAAETYGWMVLRIQRSMNSNLVAVNEHQVALAGGVNLRSDRSERAKEVDPEVRRGVTGLSRHIALIRSKTARECVEKLGELYSTYGNAYACGVGYADAEEVWYIESGGGRQWAAVKIPDDSYFVQGNGYRIGVIDPRDTGNVITSPNILEFAKEKGLWNPEDGHFNFRKAFGGKLRGTYVNARREWRAIDLLSTSLGFNENDTEFPMFAVPDKKIKLEDLFTVLRDYGAGTKYNMYPESGVKPRARVICTPRCVHTNVIQIRPDMPVDIGAVLWAGMSMPAATFYLPFYYGIHSVPHAYGSIDERTESAAHLFKNLSGLVLRNYNEHIEQILQVRNSFESRILESQDSTEKSALELYKKNPRSAQDFLTRYVENVCREALAKTGELINSIGGKVDNP